MPERTASTSTCETPECERPRLAKGLCHQHYYRGRYSEAGQKQTITCTRCGEGFERSKGGQAARSPLCTGCRVIERALAKDGPACPVYYGGCRWCGRMFVSPHKNQLLCSEECSRAERISTYRVKQKCPDCDAPKARDQQRCTPCAEVHNAATRKAARRATRQTEGYRKRKRDMNRRRRARKRGAQTERVDAAKVYERDGWRCGICRRRVNPELKYPHRMSASLDHVIPLSWDGEHNYANSQLAHFICNSIKGDRMEVQPALFG
jgi:hypothetical protein